MTDESDDVSWPAAAMANQMQQASQKALEQQFRMFERLFDAENQNDVEGLTSLAERSIATATFKCRVQSGGRISIPDAERDALDIGEGDLVQAVVVPIQRSDSNG